MKGPSIFVNLLTIEMLIPHAQSLKDKRRVVRALKDRIRNKYNASVAEVCYQNKWQRAILAVCFVGGDRRQLEADATHIRQLCEEITEAEITAINQEWL
jgi:uncharacterized protein YlxP (DUF503 family)